MEKLLDRIEELRYQLYLISMGKDLVDPEVVQASQELDRLLNAYLTGRESRDMKVG